MKSLALASLDRGDRDTEDAKLLAGELGVTDVEALRRLFVSVHGEPPTADLLGSSAAALA